MYVNVSSFIKSHFRRLVGMTFVLAVGAGLALACDTPVYRYAMYRWEPARYEIYYFHDKPLDEQATHIKTLVEQAAQADDNPVNAVFIPVSLADDTGLKRIPPDVKKAWEAQENRQVPSYWVVSPHGRKLFDGMLDQATWDAMWNSPIRAEIAKQLGEGRVGVLVLVTSTDKAANDQAEKVTKELMAEMAEGKVELYLPPGSHDDATQDGHDDDAKRNGGTKEVQSNLQFGFAKIARTDPAEKWLIDSLLSVEDDLTNDEFAAQPMVFAIFGRGRALPPFIGKGITRDNLLECAYFLTGACSCTVKEQNPGMDLMFGQNWWSIAERLASVFGAEEGNETQLGAAQMFPHLIIPAWEQTTETDKPAETAEASGSGDMAAAAAERPAGDSAAGDSAANAPAAADPAGAQTAGAEPAKAEASTTDGPGKDASAPARTAEAAAAATPAPATPTMSGGDASPSAPPAASAPATPTSAPSSSPLTTAASGATVDAIGVFAVGAGLCVALVLLAGVTFLLMRPE